MASLIIAFPKVLCIPGRRYITAKRCGGAWALILKFDQYILFGNESLHCCSKWLLEAVPCPVLESSQRFICVLAFALSHKKQCHSVWAVIMFCLCVFLFLYLFGCLSVQAQPPEEGRGRWLGGRGWDQGVGGRGAPTSLNVTFSSARPQIFTLYYNVVIGLSTQLS